MKTRIIQSTSKKKKTAQQILDCMRFVKKDCVISEDRSRVQVTYLDFLKPIRIDGIVDYAYYHRIVMTAKPNEIQIWLGHHFDKKPDIIIRDAIRIY